MRWAREFLLTHCVEMRGVQVERRCSDIAGSWDRDDRRGALQDAVAVAVYSCFAMAYRRMQTAPRCSLALVTLLAWLGGTMMGLALTPDGMALLQFKDALTIISPVLEGWNASDPSPCSWGGINCTAAGRVSEIVLTYQQPPLEGHLSASLGELTSLEVLWLDGNSLSGSIPPEIGNLSSLSILSLSFQNFSGEVPLQLFKCKILVQLWLNGNDFTGDITTGTAVLTFTLLTVMSSRLEVSPELRCCLWRSKSQSDCSLAHRIVVAK